MIRTWRTARRLIMTITIQSAKRGTVTERSSMGAHTRPNWSRKCYLTGNNPRSYIIQTPSGVIRSNQFHLMLRPTPDTTENPPQPGHNTGHDLSTAICNNGHCLEWLHITVRTLVLNNYSSVCHAVALVTTIRIVCAHYSNDLLQASPVIPFCKMEQFRMQSSTQSLRCILPLQTTFDMLLAVL